jgi:hypothetical protein
MQRIINNLLYSKKPLMVVLRYVLIALVVVMGIMRLRIILLLLASPESYTDRDTLTYFLMAKAILAGLNPYLPLNELAQRFVGFASSMTHPAPCTPITAILFIPVALFGYTNSVIIWTCFELLLMGVIAYLLTILWSGRPNVLGGIFLFFLMLAWYPVMVDILFGQLTVLLTFLLLASLLAIRKDRKILAGVLIGLSVAIKIITWPLIIFFALKKDWKTFFSSVITIICLNLVPLAILGLNPMMEYYLKISMQVSGVYHGFLKNYSLWSIGYRLFDGSGAVGKDLISAPPLVNLPSLAPWVSAGLAIAFLIVGLIMALRVTDMEIAFSIIICVIVLVSPITWDHYYVMLIISLVVLLHNLSDQSFPTWPTVIFIVLALMLFLFNDRIAEIIFALNGGIELLQAKGNQITFASSLLEILPMVEVVILTILLWSSGISAQKAQSIEKKARPSETLAD